MRIFWLISKIVENVIPEIVQQHVEETAFLRHLRDGAIAAPHNNLKYLA